MDKIVDFGKGLFSEEDVVGRISPGRGPSYIPVYPPSKEKDLKYVTDKISHDYNLRPRGIEKDKFRRRAFGSPCTDLDERPKVVQSRPLWPVSYDDETMMLEEHPKTHSPRPTMRIAIGAPDAERERAAKQLCDQMRALDSERHRLEFEYRAVMTVNDTSVEVEARPLAQTESMSARRYPEQSTQTHYFPTPYTDEIRDKTKFSKSVNKYEAPQMESTSHLADDSHPSSRFTSRTVEASLRTPRLKSLVSGCQRERVSSGVGNNKSTLRQGIRATIVSSRYFLSSR
jgi:hypothetical protein